jgi:4-amino-4-deoxy-L-arabinose transferase-like glycosyltransferase
MNRRWALILALVVAALYMASVSDRWAIKYDSALYLGLGQSLADGRGMEFNGRQWGAIPPGLPLVIAASDRLFGPHYWPLNLFERLCALGVVLVSFLILRRLVQQLPEPLRPGLLAGTIVAVAFSAQLFTNALAILTDTPFTLLMLLGLYAFVRGRENPWLWYSLGTAALMAATLTRLVGVIFLAGAAAAALAEALRSRSRRQALAAAATTLIGGAVVAACVLALRAHRGADTLDYLTAASEHSDFLSAGKWQAVGIALTRLPDAMIASLLDQRLRYLDVALAAVILAGLWTALRARQYLVIFPTVLYIAALTGLSPSSVSPRYFLPLMPIMAYGLVLGARTLAPWLMKARLLRRPETAVAVMAALCVAFCVPKIGREIYRQHHPRFYEIYDSGQWLGCVESAAYLRTVGPAPADRVLGPWSRVTHYLSGVLVALNKDPPRCLDIQHYAQIEPEVFLAAVRSGDYRFVLVPTGVKEEEKQWSSRVCRGIETSGLFRDPPQAFDGVLLYTLTARPAPAAEPSQNENGAEPATELCVSGK